MYGKRASAGEMLEILPDEVDLERLGGDMKSSMFVSAESVVQSFTVWIRRCRVSRYFSYSASISSLTSAATDPASAAGRKSSQGLAGLSTEAEMPCRSM